MADNTKLLLVGGAAVAVWYFYFRTPASVAADPGATGGGSAPPAGGGAPAPPPPAATPRPDFMTIEARTIAAAHAPADGLTVDEWGWYLNNELAAAGLPAAPDPMPLFSRLIPGFDRNQKLNAGQYFVAMGSLLHSAPYGLAGLGFFALTGCR